MSKTSWYILGGVGALVAVLLVVAQQRQTAIAVQSGGTLGGIAKLVDSIGKASGPISQLWRRGGSGDDGEGYTPQIVYGSSTPIEA